MSSLVPYFEFHLAKANLFLKKYFKDIDVFDLIKVSKPAIVYTFIRCGNFKSVNLVVSKMGL